jgi:hypothetical protein
VHGEGKSARAISFAVLSLASLFPGLLKHGLYRCSVSISDDLSSDPAASDDSSARVEPATTALSAPILNPHDDAEGGDDEDLDSTPEDDTLELVPGGGQAMRITKKRPVTQEDQPISVPQHPSKLMVDIFGGQALFHPYACLQQMDSLVECRSFFIGVTNALMIQHKTFADVVVDISFVYLV